MLRHNTGEEERSEVMVSLRFGFPSFPRPPNSTPGRPFFSCTAVATAVACTTAAGVAMTLKQSNPKTLINDIILNLNPFSSSSSSSPLWASLSLSPDAPLVVESKTGASFPAFVKDSQALLSIGLRKKCILGLKNIDIYAFGVYANEDDVQEKLKEKYGKLSASELKENKDFNEDILTSDVNLTVRLQIVYSKLSIRSVRSAFEESVGSRLQKFGGPDNKELLQRFTSQFKDDVKIPKGSVIELSREHGYVLRTIIDGEEVGSIQSKLLCQSVLDLYIGKDPFDRQAKENVMLKLANVCGEKMDE